MRADRFGDHYSQATMFWESQTDSEQAHIASAFVFELSKLTLPHVAQRVIANLANVSGGLATRVADGLGVATPLPSIPARPSFQTRKSPALSIQTKAKDTLIGRKVGIVLANGSDGQLLTSLVSALTEAGARTMTIAPKRTIRIDGELFMVDGQLAGSPSCLVDAVALVLSEESAKQLAADAAAVQFVQDAFGHLKAIGATSSTQPLLDRAGVGSDPGVTYLESALGDFVKAASTRQWDRERLLRLLA